MTQNSIQQLHDRYKSTLADKAKNLAVLYERVNSDDLDSYHLIQTNLHKLASSAGMYGYDDIYLLSKQVLKHLNNKRCKKSLILNELAQLIDLLTYDSDN